MNTMSLIPSPAQTKVLVWEAFQELEKRDKEKMTKLNESTSKIAPNSLAPKSTSYIAIDEIVAETRQGQTDIIIPPDDEGRLVYFMGKINTLSVVDGQKLVRLCRLLKSRGRMMTEEDFTTTMMASLRASGIVGIEKIVELLELILPGKNPQTMAEDLYTLIRTSPNGAINIINPQGNVRAASCILSSDIPDESKRPMVIFLSGSATVRLSRKGTTLTVESTEAVKGVPTPRKIIKKFPLTEDTSITIGRDFRLHDPLGLQTRSVILCSWGIVDQSVSRAALNIRIEKSGRIHIFDLHSANGATIEF